MEKIVNGFWYGPELDELEKLCIESWIKNGYEFHLWLYGDVEVPKGVIVENANDIVSLDEYFTYNEGHSKGTPVAFSNLFRAELLYQRGGLYVDLDVLCLKPYKFDKQFVFSEQVDSGHSYHVATCILYSENKGERIFGDWSDWILAKKNKIITHGDLGPNLFTKLITLYNLKEYVLPKEHFCPVDWQSYKDIFDYKGDSYGIHLFSSLWDDEDYKNIDKLRRVLLMDIKDIERIVQKHTDITEEELKQIDSQSNWRRVLTKQEPYEHEWEHGTTAQVNEYGYRSDNFDGGGDGFMFLGCSLTEGYALKQEDTWPWIVGKHFDVKVWNLAQGGRGDDVCFMNAIRWIPKLKPKVVCMLIPASGRFEFFDYDRDELYEEFTAWCLPKKPKFPWLFNPKHVYLSTLKNILSIKSICDEYNIPFIVETQFTSDFDGWGVEYANDGAHPGKYWQNNVAKWFIKEIENMGKLK